MAEPPSKRARGGQRQRLQALENDPSQPKIPKESSLAHLLMEKWSWGEISPQEVQILAKAATNDFEKVGSTPPTDLSYLAQLGTSGSHKKLSSNK